MPTINLKKSIKKPPQPGRKNGDSFYNTPQWKNLRNRYIREHPYCQMCLEDGHVVEAEEVHHIKPFLEGTTEEEKWSLLTDEDNLMSLCKDHHHQVHNEKKKFNKASLP